MRSSTAHDGVNDSPKSFTRDSLLAAFPVHHNLSRPRLPSPIRQVPPVDCLVVSRLTPHLLFFASQSRLSLYPTRLWLFHQFTRVN